MCYDFSARLESVTAVLQKTQAFWEIVPRRLEGSWCLSIHSEACKKVKNDPSKSREIFTQRHSATRQNTRNLRSDSSIIFVRTDIVTRKASADSQQSPCRYFTLWRKVKKKFATHNFRFLYQNIQVSSYLCFYERANLSLIVTFKAMLPLLTAYGYYEICFTQNKKLQHC